MADIFPHLCHKPRRLFTKVADAVIISIATQFEFASLKNIMRAGMLLTPGKEVTLMADNKNQSDKKPQIVIEYYNPSEKIVEGKRIDTNNTYKRFREKGLSVEEFKKAIRQKFGDTVEIVNHAKKHNDNSIPSTAAESSRKVEDERFSSKDIRYAMRNDSMKQQW